jgi:hypothetical protein
VEMKSTTRWLTTPGIGENIEGMLDCNEVNHCLDYKPDLLD